MNLKKRVGRLIFGLKYRPLLGDISFFVHVLLEEHLKVYLHEG